MTAAGRTAPQAAEGPWDEAPQPPGVLLEALRWAWDGIYVIAPHADGGLVITRADRGGSFRAGDPLAARDEILADYSRRPVARRPPDGALGRRMAFERAHPEVKWDVPSLYHRARYNAGGKPQEVAAASVDGLLDLLRRRGFTW